MRTKNEILWNEMFAGVLTTRQLLSNNLNGQVKRLSVKDKEEMIARLGVTLAEMTKVFDKWMADKEG